MLKYNYNDLEPVINQQIMELHHDKHYQAYVTGAKAALEKLAKIRSGEITGSRREAMRDYSFNYNGVLLHEIFWDNMRKPQSENKAGGTVLSALENSFGTWENFVSEFSEAAITVEGSGWAALWKNNDETLVISQIEKHNLLGLNGMKPILVLDVWEHAYYLQYLNDRKSYVTAWWQVVNWDDVEARLK